MRKPKSDPVSPESEVLEHSEPVMVSHRSRPRWLWVGSAVAGVALLGVLGFELLYAGKVLPGVSANGAYLGGLPREEAVKHLDEHTRTYQERSLPLAAEGKTISIPVQDLNLSYDNAHAADLALSYGHRGNPLDRLVAHARALLGRPATFAAANFDDARLASYLRQLDAPLASAPTNATITFADGQAGIAPGTAARRLDLGRTTQRVQERLASGSTDPVEAVVYNLEPSITTAVLERGLDQTRTYTKAPLELTIADRQETVDQARIVSWLRASHAPSHSFATTYRLSSLNPIPSAVTLTLDRTAITAYVAELAKSVDQPTANAHLAMVGGQLTVTRPSKEGRVLNQDEATKAITEALTREDASRTLTLNVAQAPAEISEATIANLGIKDQLSDGITYFPGSGPERLTNLRIGARTISGTIIKPGGVFSLGEALGPVGAEQGYVPAIVILQNRQEKQYGGGLSQLSSTTFRAALLAGLPILERGAHSYSVQYYLAPYGVPGVESTLFYPQLDMKWKNDTDHYILVQTEMVGTSLHVQLFGTKTKEGRIRGPEFLEGNLDATKPSKTIFWRDVVAGDTVLRTDTFITNYRPSTDFPNSF